MLVFAGLWSDCHIRDGDTHPPVFGERVRKALKTKERRPQKRGKRVQEAARDWRERS
jgi:hypothetical protein